MTFRDVDIKSKREIPKGSAVYAGKEGYAIVSPKGPIIGYAIEDSHPLPDGKHHIVKAMIHVPDEVKQ
jgi:hypothetical protein